MCLTANTSNQVPFTRPASYNSSTWELARRYFAALGAQATLPLGLGDMPNGKVDANNKGPVSTDFIGMNWNYPTASYAARKIMWQAHKDYTQGLLWFLATDPAVPPAVQAAANSYGLCRDEFTETDHWPEQLYVREARRLVGDAVFTQTAIEHNRGRPLADAIGMGSYNYDSHYAQRYACTDQTRCANFPRPYAWNEGDTEVSPGA